MNNAEWKTTSWIYDGALPEICLSGRRLWNLQISLLSNCFRHCRPKRSLAPCPGKQTRGGAVAVLRPLLKACLDITVTNPCMILEYGNSRPHLPKRPHISITVLKCAQFPFQSRVRSITLTVISTCELHTEIYKITNRTKL